MNIQFKNIISSIIVIVFIMPLCMAKGQAQPDIYAQYSIDQQHLFQHEPFMLTLAVYSKNVTLGNSFNINGLTENPDINITSKFNELASPRKGEYNVKRFRCEARVDKPGKLLLKTSLNVTLLRKTRSMFGYAWTQTGRAIGIKPLAITVLPIPEQNVPDSFTGAIGQYAFNVAVAPNDLTLGDLINVKMTIKGKGYLGNLKTLRMKSIPNVKMYDSKLVKSEDDSMTFMQTLIPQSTNVVEIPSVTFSYFDPHVAAYRTITKGPFPIRFHKREKVEYKQYNHKQELSGKPDEPTSEDVQTNKDQAVILRKALDVVDKTVKAVLIKKEKGRIAPSDTAYESFDLQQGAEVTILKQSDDWIKISVGSKRAWIHGSSVKIK